ncbi:hypothetical protein BJX64DRAFT_291813 [Aspergillus heterothallicus]
MPVSKLKNIVVGQNEFARCMLCGCVTCAPYPVWLDAVRVLYPTKGNVLLSEICSRFHEFTLGIESDENVLLNFRENPWATSESASYPVGGFFILHDFCWQYANKCWDLECSGIQVKGFYDTLRRLPPPKDPYFRRVDDYHPCMYPDIKQILKDVSLDETPKPSGELKSHVAANIQDPSDKFRRFPLELQQLIASSLPTRDFFNLRYASRAMSVLFNDSMFWKSRFEKGGDRSFLEYLLEHNASKTTTSVDWRLLYHAWSKIENKSDITARVWEVLQWMQDTLRARQDPDFPWP